MNSSRDVTKHKGAEERIRFQSRLLEAVGQAVIATDPQGKIIYWNRAAEVMYGWSAEEVMGRSILEVAPSEELMERAQEIMSELMAGKSWSGEFVVRRKDGTTFPAMVTDTPVHDEQGNLLAIIGVSTDITEIKQTEELRRSEERFRLLVEGVKDYAIFMLDADGCITSWNAGAERIKGYKSEEILNRHFSCFHTEEDIERGHPEEELRLAQEQGRYEEEGLRVRKDGSLFWANVSITALRDTEGNLRGFSKVVRDITERKALEEQLKHRAYHDPLTGLPNRTLLMDRLEQALARSEQRADQVAILLMDLDDLKVINDSLGHECGDRLLVSVARRLQALLRPQDTVARFGGDEFVILLDESDAEAASRVAQRLVEGMRTFFALDGRELTITCSIGIALGSGGAASAVRPPDLLRRADMALYEAKAKGKNRCAVFEEAMEARTRERLEKEHSLRQTIEREKGFVVHYQPVVSLETGRIVGFEALVRWNHPWRGLLMPGEFLPLAEQTGVIVAIGPWVFREACRQAKEWHECYPSDPPLTVSVNLSARQLTHPSLVEDVAYVLKSSGVERRSLILEVTESAMMRDVDASVAVLRRLKDLGVRIAIDDFGKDYSSLSYLKRLPVDILKIDRSFVAGLGTDGKDEGIVRAVFDLARTLGLEVIAEGVESGEQLEHLREAGCDLAQGFYFWHPLPAERANELLATYNYA